VARLNFQQRPCQLSKPLPLPPVPSMNHRTHVKPIAHSLGVTAAFDSSFLPTFTNASRTANPPSLENKDNIHGIFQLYAIDLDDDSPPLYAAILIIDNSAQPPSTKPTPHPRRRLPIDIVHAHPPPHKDGTSSQLAGFGLHTTALSQIEDGIDDILGAYFAGPDDDAQSFDTTHHIDKPLDEALNETFNNGNSGFCDGGEGTTLQFSSLIISSIPLPFLLTCLLSFPMIFHLFRQHSLSTTKKPSTDNQRRRSITQKSTTSSTITPAYTRTTCLTFCRPHPTTSVTTPLTSTSCNRRWNHSKDLHSRPQISMTFSATTPAPSMTPRLNLQHTIQFKHHQRRRCQCSPNRADTGTGSQ
jgi:hypothetical protein